MKFTYKQFLQQKVLGLPLWFYLILSLAASFFSSSGRTPVFLESVILILGGPYTLYLLAKLKKLGKNNLYKKVYLIVILLLAVVIIFNFYKYN